MSKRPELLASPFDEKFDQFTNKLLKDFHVPGLSIAIIEGKDVFSKGYGLADIPSNTPAVPETLYYICSITKHMFATTLAKYIHGQDEAKDKITWQTKLAEIIREDFVLDDPWATNHITFEDAFCHRTGLARHNLIFGGSFDTPKEITRAMRYIPLSTEPRHVFDYCNTMFAAVTHALEVKTGESLNDTMEKLLFKPLGMHDTHTSREAALEKGHGKVRFYDGYEWYGKPVPDGQGHYVKADHESLACAGGAGFVISNVIDMAQNVKAWLGHHDGLSKDVRNEVSRPRIPTTKNIYNEEYAQYALGLDRRSYHGVEIIGHNGGTTGWTTLMNFVPALDFGFVVLGNSNTASSVAEILFYHLLNERLHVDKEKQFDFIDYYQKQAESSAAKSTLEEAMNHVYPSVSEKTLPLNQSIAEYTGSFNHPAYRTFTFEVKSGTEFSHGKEYLEAIVADRTWPFVLRLYHVSGDYWLALSLKGLVEREGQNILELRAIARHEPDGTVKHWGIEIEPDQKREDWKDKLIWFTREPSSSKQARVETVPTNQTFSM